MMKRMLVLGLLLVAAPALAADIDGRWSGTIETPNGEVPIGFTFKADGATLTGTMAGFDGMEIPIKSGKVDGNTIAFAVEIDFGGMPFELTYKGVVTGSDLKLTGEFGGMPFEFALKKSQP